MSRIYRIGDLTLDAGRQELRRGAESLHLGPLTYRLLLALIEAAPNVVGHDALADAVWDGRAVSNETISRRIKLLREAVGDDPHEPRYIELLRGRGYRLIPPVVVDTGKAAGRPRGARLLGIAAMIAAAVAGFTWLVFGTDPVPPPDLSVAVLPFDDMSPRQDQEYLADGIAAEILNVLSRSTPLKVTAQTSSFSFKGRNADVATIAQALHVSHVLEGSVRKSGIRIRISAQLVSAADGMNVWSETYDRDIRDVLDLQREIAGSVAAALETRLIGEEPRIDAAPKQVDPEAFTAYLRGQQQLLKPGFAASLDEAVRFFEKSIEIDPSFLPAYSSLGMLYALQIVSLNATVTENLPKLRELAEQVRNSAPGESAVLLALEGQVARYEGDIELARQRLERAADLDPFDIRIASQYAMFKLDQGFPNAALQVYQRLAERDPLNPGLYSRIWACHMDRGDARKAIVAATRMEEFRPVVADRGLQLALRTQKRGGAGLRAIARALLLGDIAGSIREDPTRNPEDWYPYPILYYTLGDREKGDAALKRWQQVLAPYAVDTSEARMLRGDVDGALDALEQAERDGTLYIAWHVFLLHNEIFADIRHDPRFESLVSRVREEMARQRAELDAT